MTIESNRETAIHFLHSIGAAQPDWDLLSPDAMWWVQGRGEYPARALLEVICGRVFSSGHMDIVGVTAEGDRVAVEATSCMQTLDSREYRNSYHFLLEFRDGLIVRAKEYIDTAQANRFHGQDMFNPG